MKTRIQTQRPIAKGRHQKPNTRWSVRENPPSGANWGGKTWPGTGAGTPPVMGQWNFETQTVVAPTAGAVRFNNATPASVTAIFLSETLAGGSDPIAGFAVNDPIRIYLVSDTSIWVEYKITAATDAGAYRNYTVTYTGASTGWATPAAATPVYILEKTATPQTGEPQYDPGEHTVDEVKAHVEGLGDESDLDVVTKTQAILDLERAGQNRSTLVSWLAARDGVV